MGENLSKVADTFGALGIREAAVVEDVADLLVEFGAVGDDDNGRVLLGRVAAEFGGEPQHRERLARALGMPDHAAALGGASPCGCAASPRSRR
jgi:hypothetical protein